MSRLLGFRSLRSALLGPVGHSFALLLLLGWALASPGAAQTVIIEPDRDTTIYEDDPSIQRSNGSGTRGHFGVNQINQRRRYLVRFDLEGVVPTGSLVTNVRLRLNVSNFSPNSTFNMAQHLHRVTRAWGEGSSDAGFPGGNGAVAQPGDASWHFAFVPGMPWLQPGGDFLPIPSVITQHNTIGPIYFSSPQMVADVASWILDPSSNHGWLIKDSFETPNTAFVFSTREDSSPMAAPTLEITYSPIPVNILAFCDPAAPNSSGQSTKLGGLFTGTSGTGLHLEATGGPADQFGYFLVGSGSFEPGIVVADGRLCLDTSSGASIGRYNLAGSERNSVGQFDATGTLQNLVGTSSVGSGFDVPTSLPTRNDPLIAAGSTWHFQLWHRDGQSSNLSNGLSVTF